MSSKLIKILLSAIILFNIIYHAMLAIRFFYGSQKVKGLVVFPLFDNQWHAFKTRFTSVAPFLKALSEEEYCFLRVVFFHTCFINSRKWSLPNKHLVCSAQVPKSISNFCLFASSSHPFSQPEEILKSR